MHPPRIVVQLIHIHGRLMGEILEFDGNEVSIGRLPSCSVRFPAPATGEAGGFLANLVRGLKSLGNRR